MKLYLLRNFLHTKYVGQKRFHLKVENPLYLRYSLIKVQSKGVEQFVMGHTVVV
jgi:2-oxoglutarate dehydrogenase complex dehydrogenase (E1) component-like enzyme